MAAPHVAGGFALLKAARPDATVDQILTALQVTGLPITDTRSAEPVTKPRIRLLQALSSFFPDVPFIGSITPAVGGVGTTLNVTITGANFQSGGDGDVRRRSRRQQHAFGSRSVALTNPGGQMAVLAGGFTVAPASPSLALRYVGKLRDRVRQSATVVGADAVLDATFTVTVQSTLGVNRSVTELDLRRSGAGGIWDTIPATTYWILGAASTLDGPVVNASNGTVSFPAAEGQTFYIFVADTSPSQFVPGCTFVFTVRFADGATATANAVVPLVPTIALSYPAS